MAAERRGAKLKANLVKEESEAVLYKVSDFARRKCAANAGCAGKVIAIKFSNIVLILIAALSVQLVAMSHTENFERFKERADSNG